MMDIKINSVLNQNRFDKFTLICITYLIQKNIELINYYYLLLFHPNDSYTCLNITLYMLVDSPM